MRYLGGTYYACKKAKPSLTPPRFTELETYVSPSVVKMLVGNKLDKVTVLVCEHPCNKLTEKPAGVQPSRHRGRGTQVCRKDWMPIPGSERKDECWCTRDVPRTG
jgi:hypothetical protein